MSIPLKPIHIINYSCYNNSASQSTNLPPPLRFYHHTARVKIAAKRDKVMKSFAFAIFLLSLKAQKIGTKIFLLNDLTDSLKMGILGENSPNRSKPIELYLSSYSDHFEIYMTKQFVWAVKHWIFLIGRKVIQKNNFTKIRLKEVIIAPKLLKTGSRASNGL